MCPGISPLSPWLPTTPPPTPPDGLTISPSTSITSPSPSTPASANTLPIPPRTVRTPLASANTARFLSSVHSVTRATLENHRQADNTASSSRARTPTPSYVDNAASTRSDRDSRWRRVDRPRRAARTVVSRKEVAVRAQVDLGGDLERPSSSDVSDVGEGEGGAEGVEGEPCGDERSGGGGS